jgi:hypothetical protein
VLNPQAIEKTTISSSEREENEPNGCLSLNEEKKTNPMDFLHDMDY